jgi:23S rRNA (adenine2503-C2)-methyltransferase
VQHHVSSKEMNQTNTKSIYSLTLEEMRQSLADAKLPKYAADQVYQWIYKQNKYLPESWSNVSKKVKNHLLTNFTWDLPKRVWEGVSTDGTRKFLIGLVDGQTIETVAIFSKERVTLCISSQVGCAIGCTFCYTGTLGLTRHLASEEIVGQYLMVNQRLRELDLLREDQNPNIVYMGQGEPLHNFDNVSQATKVIMEPKGIGLGQRKITLSTSGLVPQIEKLSDFPPVNIAISLHAARDNLRTELMPINKAYDLKRLFEAIKTIPLKGHRSITYEYILISEYNDGEEDVAGLLGLLDKKKSKINLIPFNEHPSSKFKKPTPEKVDWFRKQFLDRGYVCTVRVTKGDDIYAACGQLKNEVEQNNKPQLTL